MLLDTHKNERIKIGLVVVRSKVTGRDLSQVKVANGSSRKWARVFLGSFGRKLLFGRPFRCEVAPGKTFTFRNVPCSIIDVTCNEIQ